jgi:oxygen-independent coproporphyrinogen III oxidase
MLSKGISVIDNTDLSNIDNLLKKYDRPGPRYTSYPMVPVWSDEFGHEEYQQSLKQASESVNEPLSLYLHIPFCRKRCWFCGCNTTTLKKATTHATYLNFVESECEMACKLLGERKKVSQFHWGGGTPSSLNDEQTRRAFKIFVDRFVIEQDAEISIELDPRVTGKDRIDLLKSLGFNRLSFGVQDFNADVQSAIGRNQEDTQAVELYNYSRKLGFTGINFDLIYGLPMQTAALFEKTLDKTIALRPDRVAMYSFAYLPKAKAHQTKINADLLPSPAEKLELYHIARRKFTESGYIMIGMDHFVLPDDELGVAMEEGRLRRNFMGYTVLAARDWLGFGMSSISYVNKCFVQNISTLSEYQQRIESGKFAAFRGLRLSEDDLIRQFIISELMCNLRIDIIKTEQNFGIKFADYFSKELDCIQEFKSDGLLDELENRYRVTEIGRIFVRNIAMVFDAYLKDDNLKVQFSRTV